jgi:hypothetical protein
MHPRERLAFSPIEGRPPLKFPKGVRLLIWPVLARDMERTFARLMAHDGVVAWGGAKILGWFLAARP